MAFPIVFIWFLIAIFIFRHHLRKNSKAQESLTNAFWEKEESSLVVRKKDLAPEDYIHPTLTADAFRDLDYYKAHHIENQFRHAEYLTQLLEQPMVNFQHTTNTELRLHYGTAMITAIEAYENSFLAYTNTLFQLAKAVLEAGDHAFALLLLEEGIQVGTDNRGHFLLLAKIYKDNGEKEKLAQLLQKAKSLQSLTKEALLRDLIQLLEA